MTFTLSLSFDFAQDIRKGPIVVSLSNREPVLSQPISFEELRTNGWSKGSARTAYV